MAFFKRFSQSKSSRIYLDVASSTPVDEAMLGTFPTLSPGVLGANPSALHKEGVAARAALADARALVAHTLDAHPDELIFTSNATESDNLALSGLVQGLIAQGISHGEILLCVSAIEHSAVSEMAQTLSHYGVRMQTLECVHGAVDPKDITVPEGIKALIVSVMYVNNEIGTVQPVKAIAKRIRFLRKHHPDTHIFFHTDATQAPLYYMLGIPQLGVDMMTLGATKLYCPKGVGLLYVRRGTPVRALMHGGGQQFGLRPGTEPLALIHVFSHALCFAQKNVDASHARTRELQDYFEKEIKKSIPSAVITAQSEDRTPHITHIAVKNFDSELLVLELDARGIAVSAKSACKNEDSDESSIVESIYGARWGAVRFSFGRTTTKKDLDTAVTALVSVLKKYAL